jgi:hypothetical protein
MINDKRSSWKDQFFHYPNASKFHNSVRDIFRTDIYFKNLKCFQEVPLSGLVASYPNNFDAIDWFVDELNTVVELHGKQHYEQVIFGYKSYQEAKKDFHNIQFRDNRKKTFLVDAGYNYVEISYKDAKKINANFIKDLIFYQE